MNPGPGISSCPPAAGRAQPDGCFPGLRLPCPAADFEPVARCIPPIPFRACAPCAEPGPRRGHLGAGVRRSAGGLAPRPGTLSPGRSPPRQWTDWPERPDDPRSSPDRPGPALRAHPALRPEPHRGSMRLRRDATPVRPHGRPGIRLAGAGRRLHGAIPAIRPLETSRGGPRARLWNARTGDGAERARPLDRSGAPEAGGLFAVAPMARPPFLRERNREGPPRGPQEVAPGCSGYLRGRGRARLRGGAV